METRFSIKHISDGLVDEIKKALNKVEQYGSVELFIQNGIVTQITTRSIKKTTKVAKTTHIS